MKSYLFVINRDFLNAYYDYYFNIHKKATVIPIKSPCHPSVNEWMIMKRPMMNALKQKWLDFVHWLVEKQGYSNLHIDKCDIEVKTFYPSARRHDPDNSVIKFILDGFCSGGFIVDDDFKHIKSLKLMCDVDVINPRTEITIFEI